MRKMSGFLRATARRIRKDRKVDLLFFAANFIRFRYLLSLRLFYLISISFPSFMDWNTRDLETIKVFDDFLQKNQAHKIGNFTITVKLLVRPHVLAILAKSKIAIPPYSEWFDFFTFSDTAACRKGKSTIYYKDFQSRKGL